MKDKQIITRWGLIRHAQTVWNLERRIQGHKDAPLSSRGRRQAQNWGRGLKQFHWDRIYTSDLGRAMQTATLINKTLQVPLSPDNRLREQDWGAWTGKTEPQIQRNFPEYLKSQEQLGWEFCPPGGEDRNMVWARSQNALQEGAARWPGETILVVAHEGVLKCLLYRLSNRKFLPKDPPMLRPYHLHWLIHDGNKIKLEKVNAISLDQT